MNIKKLSAAEVNNITLDTEQNIERLRELAFYWQSRTEELMVQLKKSQPPLTDEQIRSFSKGRI